MGATTDPQASPADHSDHLTILYTSNPDGWVTAQIEEFPAAISQGATEHDAKRNVLDAYHDLTHKPTLAERIAYTAQARLDWLRDASAPAVSEFVERARREALAAWERYQDRSHV